MDDKLDKRNDLRKALVNEKSIEKIHQIEDKLDEVESTLAKHFKAKHIETITENVEGLGNIDGKFNTKSLWKLKNKVIPKNIDTVTT